MVNLTPETLRSVRLFQRMTGEELGKIVELGLISSYESHSNIVIEGELSGGLFVILQGSVGVYKMNKLSGDTYDVGVIHEGGFFGEMSLIDEHPRSATVRALSDCQLFFLSKEAFEEFLAKAPDTKTRFYENCVRDLVTRLRDLDDNYIISQYQLWKSAIRKEEAA